MVLTSIVRITTEKNRFKAMSDLITSAFAFFPTKERGGALTTSSFAPLTLHALRVDVQVLGFCVQVKLHMECINETAENRKIFLAYPLPIQWELMSCVVQYNGHEQHSHYEPSKVFATSEAASGLATLTLPDPTVPCVATQYIPWEMMVGTSIYAVATYLVPLPHSLPNNMFEFTLPAELFPMMKRPHSTVLKYNTLFQLNTPKMLKAGIAINVEGTLFHPLRKEVLLLRKGGLSGPEHNLKAHVECHSDSRFTMQYHEPTPAPIHQPFLIRCPIAPTLEPLRLFAAVEMSKEDLSNSPSPLFGLEGTTSDTVVDAVGKYALCIGFSPLGAVPYRDHYNTELVFVLDSHRLDSSKAMAEAIRLMLPGLPSSVYVNFIFPRDNGKDVAVYVDGSQPLEKVEREKIVAYIEELQPQVPQTGSSRLPVVLNALFREQGGRGGGRVPMGYARNIIILSDEGEKHATTDLLREAVHHVDKVRVSAVALTFSSIAEIPLFTLLAEETCGLCEEAATPEHVPQALLRIVAGATCPTLTNLSISITSETDDTPPEQRVRLCFSEKRFPLVPMGIQRHFYLLVPSSSTAESVRVLLSGNVGELTAEFTCECSLTSPSFTNSTAAGDVSSIGLLHLTAASARVKFLTDPDVGQGTALEKSSIDEIKRISSTCGLPTPFTQLVQITSNIPVVESQTPKLAITAPYVSVAQSFMPKLQQHKQLLCAYDIGKKPLRMSELPIAASMPRATLSTEAFLRQTVLDIVRSSVGEMNMRRLVSLQHPDGSFTLNSVFGTCLGASITKLEEVQPEQCRSESVWATVIALKAAKLMGSLLTVLMERQAERFLRETLEDEELTELLLARAQTLIVSLSKVES